MALGRGGLSLAAIAVDALLTVADAVVFASPGRDGITDARVRFVLEDPPFGGPVAGIAAAVDALGDLGADSEVYLLAGDLADPFSVVALLKAAPFGPDGTVPVDEEGWPSTWRGGTDSGRSGAPCPATCVTCRCDASSRGSTCWRSRCEVT
ncbi:NTP transferase domain-containing protein [Tessaracoccus sp. HDW20]|uniref:molybdenum cofactor guanylyltransferase n=1 Tax=Tessaracoccus coleopterorum TaxID=2714950 RepID=UPI0018D35335|nr:NTP transferase domain-containing protein [Tessaracoccus coleopterorum]NHB84210.1 NTP transferase domain-containing protein [Tessaracoccus coleopterorum]